MKIDNYNIAVISGDGIGPEVVKHAVRVIEKIGEKYNHNFSFTEVMAGGIAIDTYGECLPNETLEICKNSSSVLLGAVGGPKWDGMSGDKRPEQALLSLRAELGLYANLRPATMHKSLSEACPLKHEIVGDNLDIMVVRELTGGIYFGDRGYREGKYGKEAYDTESYSEEEVKRISRTAFEVSMQRNKKLVSVDKANVLESSRLWRKTIIEMSKEYPQVELSHMYVDNAAMQLVRNPKQFDVIVTSNMFGDILSDEASMITGSIGMLPSASLGITGFGMYEPIHGSAPDITGKDIANPIAAILSAAMMMKYTFKMDKEAENVERAVAQVLEEGYRTVDIMSEGMTEIGTEEMGKMICEKI